MTTFRTCSCSSMLNGPASSACVSNQRRRHAWQCDGQTTKPLGERTSYGAIASSNGVIFCMGNHDRQLELK